MKIRNLPKAARKYGAWFFKHSEQKLVQWLVPRTPSWLETYHLTLMTLFWMALAILSGYLAKRNFDYLWLMSVAVAGQYITDLLDGAVGRSRQTGLVKWGFYMDHLLDFFFLCAVLCGYWFITPADLKVVLFALLCLSGGYFTHTILFFGSTGQYEIATMGIGPTEIRLVFVIVNAMLAVGGVVYFPQALMLVFALYVLTLAITIWRTSQRLWEIDMKKKMQPSENTHDPFSQVKKLRA